MWLNHLKLSWRNLLKDKFTSSIHLGGLSLGLSIAMLIGLWIYDELSFNRYHSNYDQIGIVRVSETRDGKIGTTRITGVPMATELVRNYVHYFKYVVRSTQLSEYILAYGDRVYSTSGNYMEKDAPSMFSLKIKYGSKLGLQDPHSILLSVSLAEKYFGKTDPTGLIMNLNRRAPVMVTGVYEDIPQNSELFKMDFIAPFDLYVLENDWVKGVVSNWRDNFLKTFVQLNPSNTFESVSTLIKDIKRLHSDSMVAARQPVVFLQPMSQWHLHSKFENGKEIRSEPLKQIWLFGVIGLFVLLLACINFINLSTVYSEKKAKEVGIRKTLGSGYGQLIFRFFSESMLIIITSWFISLFILFLLLPWFNTVADKTLVLPLGSPWFWLSGACLALLTAFLAGTYPALILASYTTVNVLKKNSSMVQSGSWLRYSLVIVQFSISVTMMICTGVVFKQVQHARQRNLGYEQNGLLELNFASSNDPVKTDLFRNELLKKDVILDLAVSGGAVTEIWSNNGGFEWKDKDPGQIAYFGTLSVSPEFGKTVDWEIKQGRDFSSGNSIDSSGLILNESAVEVMGLKNPVGEFINRSNTEGKSFRYQVIGVVGDMMMDSPYEPAKPSVFFIAGYKGRTLLKLNPAISINDALVQIEDVHKKVFTNAPFEYRFIDEALDEKFKQESRLGTLTSFFAVVSIFISCLGLFGVASFLVEKRNKEIGIRKVLGASIPAIWKLLSVGFLSQVLISILLAGVIGYFIMHQWLQNYTFRIPMPWWVFIASGVSAMLISILTVSLQAIKAARANPVKALRAVN